MREIFENFTNGALCKFNLCIAVVMPFLAALPLEEKARIFAALATGVWFTLQIALALIDRRRKARRERLADQD